MNHLCDPCPDENTGVSSRPECPLAVSYLAFPHSRVATLLSDFPRVSLACP